MPTLPPPSGHQAHAGGSRRYRQTRSQADAGRPHHSLPMGCPRLPPLVMPTPSHWCHRRQFRGSAEAGPRQQEQRSPLPYRLWSGSGCCAGSSGASDTSGTRAASRADRRPTPMCSIHPATQSSTAELYIRAIELNFFTSSSRRLPTAPPQRPHSLNDERSCRNDCSRQGAAGPSELPDRTPGPRSRRRAFMQGTATHHVPRKRRTAEHNRTTDHAGSCSRSEPA